MQLTPSLLGVHWRHLVTLLVVVGSVALVLSQQPLAQDPNYHDFADRRAFFGIPNFFDVASNLAFLVVGIAGLRICLVSRREAARNAWLALFAGVTLVSVGSAYYHWNPSSQTLVWDRLPMTVAFMSLFAALVAEYISDRLGAFLLAPALLLGLYSVLHWHGSGDLRLYAWVQLIPVLTIVVVAGLYRARYSHRWLLLAALGWYALGKLAEADDWGIFVASQGLIGGHTVKHLLSASGCLTLLLMLHRRKPLES